MIPYEKSHFIDTQKNVWNYSLFTDPVIKRFQEGHLNNAYDFLGSKPLVVYGISGYYFAVWAPFAKEVSVIGAFNDWEPRCHCLFPRLDQSGIWEGFIPAVKKGTHYKYHIISSNQQELFKSDPYAHFSELRPATASITWDVTYQWKDKKWMKKRSVNNSLSSPWNVYELHLGSWMKPCPNDENSFNSYLQLAELLIPYLIKMNVTHVELMPVMEFPYDASWGYQCTGYFAATSRFGTPQELMFLVDQLHQNNIGVIFDWVPSHFPGDTHGLYLFDGNHTYEYADKRKGFHPDWNSYIFNYGRGEVQSFLLSSAHFWCKNFHADGIRVDAVNSIIRLDFSRKEGEWEPNEKGSNENLEAIDFLKKLNQCIYRDFPDVQTIAEEASDWKGITTPTEMGGLGFGMKWMMGWMHDTFRYFKYTPAQRPSHQNIITFSMMYFYHENFMLPLSHDEVVHGKSPLLYKMPGNSDWQKFANLRLLYTYMYTHPGTKLLFMGNEFGQTNEWNEKTELSWGLLEHDSHQQLQQCVSDLGKLYKNEKALHEWQFNEKGFEWIELNKRKEAVLIFRRKASQKKDDIIVVLNFSNHSYTDWKFTTEGKLTWKEVYNSNDSKYWGNGCHLNHELKIQTINKKNKQVEVKLFIPALSGIILK